MGAVQAAARCGAHAEVAAVDVCKRCGRFLCAECVELKGEDAYCADCATKLPKGRAWLSVAALLFSVAVWLTPAAYVVGLWPVPVLAGFAATLLAVVQLVRAPQDRRWTVSALVLSALFLVANLLLVGYAIARWGRQAP